MIFSFYETVALFFIYAFLGWCIEVAFVAVTVGKVVNRGFLNGPICPIYGIGMVGMLTLLTPLQENLLFLFVGAIIVCTTLELFVGWILDKLFHMRWWDYSDKPFNLEGYICLEFSLMWGIGALVMVRLVHPAIFKVVCNLPVIPVVVVLVILTVAFVVDAIVTLMTVVGMTRNLGQLEKVADKLNEIGEQLKDVVGNSAIATAEKLDEQKEKASEAYEYGMEELKLQKMEMEDRYQELLEKLQKQSRRQINAFPTFKISGSKEKFKDKIDELRLRRK